MADERGLLGALQGKETKRDRLLLLLTQVSFALLSYPPKNKGDRSRDRGKRMNRYMI